MPKVVDHEARRRELAEAVWRVVQRDGIQHASVRTVAAESGWSSGSLRHYFPTQDALLGFAMEMAFMRFVARLETIDKSLSNKEIARQIIHRMLPLDSDRRVEATVLLSFIPRSLADGSLHEMERTGTRMLYEWFTRLMPGPDPGRQARQVVAMMDGLTMHHLTGPDDMPADELVSIMDDHLDRLFAAAE